MGTAIVITSGKGGVGKTTSTANIGTALALQGKKVCLIDMDIGLRNLDVILGLENRIIYDIVDVVEERAKLHQAIIKDKRFNDNLYLLPAAQNADKSSVSGEQMIEIVDQLRPDYDYILIDCPAGIEQGFKNSIAAADSAIVITTPEISAVRDADRIIGLLEQTEMESPRLIINRIRQRMMQEGEVLDIDEITKHLSIDLLGIVFDDDSVIRSSNKGDPIVLDPKNPASLGYRNIARRILGETVPLMSFKKEKKNFFQKIFGK
ncbi:MULTISPECIES: septum site-determining protein MinD [Carnobacterium]|jgi:septum site-determining protein MinD|uniref:Septum site-determining protein MinD n=2 Tax=Carnobacterium TaxID=2747 RepID=A0AAW9JUJ1_CARML|nr:MULTISPECIES: septum site-determining protein MinD [Carnobacterium]AOA01704.1 septum site-determining protein MinD [Carnobacterium maltaromaticum]KRN64864.1 septum site-determining protein MinD [Carnobacterium maltaromaticum DSM 20342]KRN73949.1 septum site-determining protein MinD [Carnobacterium maltaromaticum]KRN87451.1 septum site-determining protein MinD [Carnobacterium maltaromaticum]MBC9786887.1 septum site-determining protein MinD [Carnobacterium maltaromaticum]